MALFNKKKEEAKKEKQTDKKTTIVSDDKEKKIKASNRDKKTKKEIEKNIKKNDSVKNDNLVAYRVLRKPLVTEKGANLATINQYLFEISVNANKIEVGKAIKELYGVKPTSVNIINMKGKKVRFGKTMGRRRNWKKAIVTLSKGETINVYEGV